MFYQPQEKMTSADGKTASWPEVVRPGAVRKEIGGMVLYRLIQEKVASFFYSD